MAMRTFTVPAATEDSSLADAVGAGDDVRTRRKRLIGGAIELRRQHGTGNAIGGTYLLDPVFRIEDEARLRVYCDPSDPLRDHAALSPRALIIEIGFQLGEFAAAFCALRPEVRYLGFEVRRKFCTETDALLVRDGITNALLALVDAREMLPRVVQPGSVSELLVFFPDPWWKQRHVKKRLLHPEFIADAATWLQPGGRLLLKTDVLGYAEWAEAEMRNEARFHVHRLEDPAAGLPPTLRERRCGFHGYPTYAIEARKLPADGPQKQRS